MISIRGYSCSGNIVKGHRVLLLKERLFRPFAIDSRSLTGGSVLSRIHVSTTLSGKSAFCHHNHKHDRCHLNYIGNHSRPQQHHHRPFSISSSHSPRKNMLLSPLQPFSRTLYQNHPPQNLHHHNKSTTPKRSASSTNHDDDKEQITPIPLLSFSSISETPLDSTVMEKPYTLILMEDDVSAAFTTPQRSEQHQNNDNHHATNKLTTSSSWIELFRSKIPRDYGMSFASVSLQMQLPLHRDKNNSVDGDGKTRRRSLVSISDALQSLKASRLPKFSDAVLVARGPVSSLIAQYYLESFSLQGLVMIDPILLGDNANDNDNGGDDNGGDGETINSDDEKIVSSLVSSIFRDSNDDNDSIDRFRSQRLLVEPNAVPMMVVRTARNASAALESSACFVALRHGASDGPYGMVPFVDLSKEIDHVPNALLHHIDEWIDKAL